MNLSQCSTNILQLQYYVTDYKLYIIFVRFFHENVGTGISQALFEQEWF